MEGLITNEYIERLVNEWEEHGRIIIGVDFDDTIRFWRMSSQEKCDKVIKLLVLAKETGAYLVIFTACDKSRYDEIKQFCNSKGLAIDSINENPIKLPYGNERKIYANIFLDDRSGLNEAMETLESSMYVIRGRRHSVTEQTVEF